MSFSQRYIFKRLIVCLLITVSLSSCFSESTEEDSGGGLFQNHRSVENSLSLIDDFAGSYTEADTISFRLRHPSTLTVTGVPRLELNIEGTTRFVDYVSGSGSTDLLFQYTVQAGDNDLDGIEISSLIDLNGGSITFDDNGNTTAVAPSFEQSENIIANIDTQAPQIDSVVPPAPKLYLEGETVLFSLIFDETIFVTGTPKISIDLASGTQEMSYSAGSGTQTLIFEYLVQQEDVDLDGFTPASPVITTGATIKDLFGNDAGLNFATANIPFALINGEAPFVTSITPPADQTYNNTDELSFSVEFNTPVNITGNPRIEFTLGTATESLIYISGSGTKNLIFNYFVKVDDLDEDGIQLGTEITLNGGSISDADGDSAYLNFTAPLTPNIFVDAGRATVTSIIAPNSGVLVSGDVLSFDLNFSQAITVTGVPQLNINLDSGIIPVTYISGNNTSRLTFSYTIQASDIDATGVTVDNTIDLNGGTLTGGSLEANPDLTGALVPIDLTNLFVNPPEVLITSITPPGDDTYTEAESIDFIVNTSEAVDVSGSPRIPLNIGGEAKFATYISGTGTDELTFSYIVEPSLIDSDGIESTSPVELNSGTIRNSIGIDLELDFTAPNTSNVLVDSQIPLVEITSPLTATFINATNDSTTFNLSGTCSEDGETISILVDSFVAASPVGLLCDGVSFNGTIDTTSLSEGTHLIQAIIEDGAGNSGNSLVVSLLKDTLSPEVSSITAPLDQTYLSGEVISFTVIFSEDVNVTGIPQIQLTIGAQTRAANYVSGTSTDSLIFEYIVDVSDEDGDGITLSSNVIELNSGTIIDLAQNAANLNLDLNTTIPDLSAVLVSGTPPTVSITNSPNISIANQASYTIDGECNKNGITITIEVDSAPATAPIGFLCDGVNFSGTIDTASLSEGTHSVQAFIDDTAGNTANSTIIDIIKDTVAPEISSVTAPTSQTYINGETVNFTVNYSEDVTVTGNPEISLTVGTQTRVASYVSGSSTSNLIFTYTVGIGDEDTDGIEFNLNSINLASGAIIDIVENPANLQLDLNTTLPNLSSVLTDGIIPTVTITSSPSITSINQDNYVISGECSENGQIVDVFIQSITVQTSCSGNTWVIPATNVSSLADNNNLPITADHQDASANNALQANTTVIKSVNTPLVSLNSPEDITQSNETAYNLSGTCSENGRPVSIQIGTLSTATTCSGGFWNLTSFNVSSLTDAPSIIITIDHDNTFGDDAPQVSSSVSKDTDTPTVTIASAPEITLDNQTNYITSGSCSEDARNVDISIGTLDFQVNCSGNSWTSGFRDVSSLADSPAINVTADHSNALGDSAEQALNTVSKVTTDPTVSNLSIPSSITNEIDLAWNITDPSGATLNDHIINFRILGTTTWLAFDDGISTSAVSTVTELNPSTTYEFRVALIYNTTEQSPFSNIAEGTTQPESPLFDGPNIAMNVGGATDSKVAAFYDNTRVFLNGVEIAASPLNRGETAQITTAQFDIIDADQPIYTAGRRGVGTGASQQGNITWNPATWAGRTFNFSAIRATSQTVTVYAIENATVEVRNGTTLLASETLLAGEGAELSWTQLGSYQIVSTGTILAYHISGDAVNEFTDTKPLLPAAFQIIGFPSNSMTLTTDSNATNYTLIHGNSVTDANSLNREDNISIANQGGASLYQGDALVISSDQKIAGFSYADSNGFCAAPFLPTNLMRKNYIVNTGSDYVAFASLSPGTIEVYAPSDVIGVNLPLETLTLTRSGANTNAPYRVRRGTTLEGFRFISSVPVAGWYQPDNSTGGSDQDETILYGTDL